jgi:hypothetical protein
VFCQESPAGSAANSLAGLSGPVQAEWPGVSNQARVAARAGDYEDRVITFMPKQDREIEAFRKGKLIYAAK